MPACLGLAGTLMHAAGGMPALSIQVSNSLLLCFVNQVYVPQSKTLGCTSEDVPCAGLRVTSHVLPVIVGIPVCWLQKDLPACCLQSNMPCACFQKMPHVLPSKQCAMSLLPKDAPCAALKAICHVLASKRCPMCCPQRHAPCIENRGTSHACADLRR